MNKKQHILNILESTTTYTHTHQEIADIVSCSRGLVTKTVGQMNSVKIEPEFKPTLVIGDLHAPFNHPGYLAFCQDVAEKYHVERVVNIGDCVDYHMASRFVSEPDAMSIVEEMEATKKELKKWHEAFPQMYLIQGNHGSIPARVLKEIGLDNSFLKTFHQLYDIPEED